VRGGHRGKQQGEQEASMTAGSQSRSRARRRLRGGPGAGVALCAGESSACPDFFRSRSSLIVFLPRGLRRG